METLRLCSTNMLWGAARVFFRTLLYWKFFTLLYFMYRNCFLVGGAAPARVGRAPDWTAWKPRVSYFCVVFRLKMQLATEQAFCSIQFEWKQEWKRSMD